MADQLTNALLIETKVLALTITDRWSILRALTRWRAGTDDDGSWWPEHPRWRALSGEM